MGSDLKLFEVFRKELNALGYVEGKNLIIDKRQAEGRNYRLPALVSELIALHPDVLVTVARAAIAAAPSNIDHPHCDDPATDPIGSGFVKSFARPGGNIIGLANMYGDTTTKIVDVISTILPSARKIAILMSSNPTHPRLYEGITRGRAYCWTPIVAETPAGLERAFQVIWKERCDALFVLADPIRLKIVDLANAAPIPNLSDQRVC